MNGKVIVELKEIRKEFPGVVALDQVNMKIREGSVHALAGENGAGKSTLMKILSGTYTNYGGEVLIDGKTVHMKSEKEAFANMSEQEIMLLHRLLLQMKENLIKGEKD